MNISKKSCAAYDKKTGLFLKKKAISKFVWLDKLDLGNWNIQETTTFWYIFRNILLTLKKDFNEKRKP